MRATSLTIALILGLASAAPAQESGKLNWKGHADPKTAMLDARDQGKPILLYFTSAGCGYCRKLGEGAFSDPKVVEMSNKIACIYVDCDWGKKNKDLTEKFKVTGYPTVIYCDPQGNRVGQMGQRDAGEVFKDLELLANKYAGSGPDTITVVAGKNYDKALVEARRKKHPLLLYFADLSPASLSVNEALLDPSLTDLYGKFSTAKMDFVKGSPQALKFDVTRAPTILVLDSALPKPEERPLLRIEGSRSVREIRRELESVAPARAPSAAPAPGTSDAPPVVRPAPDEKLSDDEIERKFLWARVAVAQDTMKRGSKDKAIEILEDVIKSYPKHKDTAEVQKILEDLRKK